MPTVRWSDQAIADLDAVRRYIMPHNKSAALRLASRITEAAEKLGDFPNRGREIGDSMRQLSLIYPYLIRYRVESTEVVIIAIRHGARDG